MTRLFSRRRIVSAIFSLVALAVSAPTASAQQNLFNVPSGKITDLGDMFFQQQFNFSRISGSSNTTFDFGLGHDFEVGFNVLDVLLYDSATFDPDSRRQVNPDLLLNAQKGFTLVENVWDLGFGTQMGFNPARRTREVRYQAFAWVINGFELPEDWGSLYFGGYYANVAYAGSGPRGGFMFGGEIPVVKDKFHFQFDYISGKRDISVAVVGGVVMFPNKWQLSLGAQLPTFRSRNPHGVVIELTMPGYPLFHRRET